MAFSLGTLGAYTKQSIKPLLTAAVTGAKTQQLIMKEGILLTGVKSAESIPLLSTDAAFQADSCSFDASGTTAITQRTVTVGKIKVEEKLCPKELEAKFTQQALNEGSTYEDFGNAEFEKIYLAMKNEVIASQLETAIWQGDTDSLNINLNKFDGLIKLIDAGSPIDANVSGYTGIATVTTLTAANALAVVKGVKNAIPAALKGKKDTVIFCGYDFYDMYVDAGVAANLFHYDFKDDSNYGGLKIPGTGIRLEATHGLDGTGDLYAFRLAIAAMGVDLKDEETNYKMWYSEDNNDVRFRAAFKVGVNVAFTTECVKFKAAI